MPRLSHLGYEKHHNLSPSFFIRQKTELAFFFPEAEFVVEYILYQATIHTTLYIDQFILQQEKAGAGR